MEAIRRGEVPPVLPDRCVVVAVTHVSRRPWFPRVSQAIHGKSIRKRALIRIVCIFLSCMACAFGTAACDIAATSTHSTDTRATLHRTACARPAVANSPFVLPGPFSEQTTPVEFESLFGKSNVRIVESEGVGNAKERSLVLFPGDPTRRAHVSFHDSRALKGVAEISITDQGSCWRGKHGVRIGMTLAELRKVNGKKFFLSGFDDGRQGAVRDQWSPALDESDAGLGRLDVGEGEQMYFAVELGMRTNPAGVPASLFPVDESVSSDDPRFSRLGQAIRVTSFSAYTSLDDEW